MYTSNLVIISVISYLLGSIPFGYILVRTFTGADVRSQGSGNIGATNVARTGRHGLALATLVLDALKGFAAVLIAHAGITYRWRIAHSYGLVPSRAESPEFWQLFMFVGALAALMAVIGHMFPVWLHFRGGKGVATGLGVFVALAPKAVLIVLFAFLVAVVLTRYISLGSIVAAALFPACFWYAERERATPGVLAMVVAVALLIVWKHRENIHRLVAGNENKFGAKKG